ncbi:hypothetical protein WJX72_012516 [[Myrmecia] bisecta]|uniref:Amidohydrolase-related domain-containing protein n=1 Tax=[Myrmecia] bisecta TaxID=41462 RepID=A0AAW1Q836_9CHLO
MGRAGTPRPVPSGTALYKDISSLATFNAELGEITDAAIYVEGNEIAWVGKTSDIPAEFSTADQVMSLQDRIVLPGMINTHHHMVQCLTRCIAQDSALFGWLTALYPAWAHLTGDDVYIACKMAMAELILSGCTTTSDHLYIFPNDVTLDDTIRAGREVGIRFHPTRGAMSLGASKGGLPPDSVCELNEEAILKDMRRLIEEFHDNSKFAMLRIALAPAGQKNSTKELFVAAATLARSYEGIRLHTHLAENQMAREYQGVRLHTHLAENVEDIDYSIKTYGCRPGEYIKMVGWDKDDVWFAHCCCINDDEMKQFRDEGIGVAHCPSSNMRLASGIAPVRTLVDAGVNVGIGVDGSASNDCSNMIAEVRLAMFLQRANKNPKGLTAREALGLAIKGGAKNLGRTDVGEIAPGFAADFVAWRTDTLGFAGAHIDELAALLFCTPSIGFVDLSVINGAVVVQDGEIKTVDLKALVKEHNKASARICSHIKPS